MFCILNLQRHVEGRLIKKFSFVKMPPKNSGKFVINKKFNEGRTSSFFIYSS